MHDATNCVYQRAETGFGACKYMYVYCILRDENQTGGGKPWQFTIWVALSGIKNMTTQHVECAKNQAMRHKVAGVYCVGYVTTYRFGLRCTLSPLDK